MEDKEDQKIIHIHPTQAGYRDRKMAKWIGLILSDHSEAIQAGKKREGRQVPIKENLSEDLISQRLQEAFEQQTSVALQLNFVSDGQFEEDIVGKIQGLNDQQIFVQTSDDFIVVDATLIRHVDLLEAKKWWEE